MSEKFTHDRTRALIESLDARLRESEQVRNQAEERRRRARIYPEVAVGDLLLAVNPQTTSAPDSAVTTPSPAILD